MSDRHKINPFIHESSLTEYLGRRMPVVKNIGKRRGLSKLYEADAYFQDCDVEPFTKLFLTLKHQLSSLSGSACKFLFYVAMTVEKRQTEVEYDIRELEKAGMKRSTVYRVIGELCKAGIVAKSKRKERLWLNPTFMFRGSRTTMIRKLKKQGEL
jgi:hypothetical protein